MPSCDTVVVLRVCYLRCVDCLRPRVVPAHTTTSSNCCSQGRFVDHVLRASRQAFRVIVARCRQHESLHEPCFSPVHVVDCSADTVFVSGDAEEP